MRLLGKEEIYKVHRGDTITHMAKMPLGSVDLVITSPPFLSMFSYSERTQDVGNSEDLKGDGKLHLSFFYRQLARVVKPGRVVLVHCMQIPPLRSNNRLSTFDFRGFNIRLGERAGLLYEYDWLVRKAPQAQAIRTHSHKLLFVTLRRDRVVSAGAFCDYLIKFRAPGENRIPINSDEITNEEWIEWAEGAWTDIRETDTLNVREARDERDTRHVCPLQLPLINRSVRLFSNPGEIVFDPFSGIASTGYEAVRLGRRYYGCELKEKYWETGNKNLRRAETASGKSRGFFHAKPSSNGHKGNGQAGKVGRRVELLED
jgi:DNA modification methylase